MKYLFGGVIALILLVGTAQASDCIYNEVPTSTGTEVTITCPHVYVPELPLEWFYSFYYGGHTPQPEQPIDGGNISFQDPNIQAAEDAMNYAMDVLQWNPACREAVSAIDGSYDARAALAEMIQLHTPVLAMDSYSPVHQKIVATAHTGQGYITFWRPFFNPNKTREQRAHVVLHELSHMTYPWRHGPSYYSEERYQNMIEEVCGLPRF